MNIIMENLCGNGFDNQINEEQSQEESQSVPSEAVDSSQSQAVSTQTKESQSPLQSPSKGNNNNAESSFSCSVQSGSSGDLFSISPKKSTPGSSTQSLLIPEQQNSQNLAFFEYLCDDLVELILEYLPFNDKIKFERVSKQWQRCVYNKQFSIKICEDDYKIEDTILCLTHNHREKASKIRKQNLENILKRCKYIQCVQLDNNWDHNVFTLIGNHLQFLDTLKLNQSMRSALNQNPSCIENGLLEFGRNYGYKLKTLHLHRIFPRSIEEFLSYCTNVTKLEIHSMDNLLNYIVVDRNYLPKLETIRYLVVETEEDIINLRILTEKYSNQIKQIDVFVNKFGRMTVSYISNFVNLQHLYLDLYEFKHNNECNSKNIDYYIRKLSENCGKLKYIHFGWDDSEDSIGYTLPVNMFYAFSKFSSAINLEINIKSTNESFECKSECFKLCSNLKYLSLDYRCIEDDLFQDISHNLPNLRSIDIKTERTLTDQSLISLSKLLYLKKVHIKQNLLVNNYITDIGVCELINSCVYIEDICLLTTPKITKTTIDNLIAIALERKRISIKFRFSLRYACNELGFLRRIDIRFGDLPHNLKIITRY